LKTSWKKYIHLLANWMYSKCFIYQSVPTWDNYSPLLDNWIQSKSFICQSVLIWKNYFHLLVIECIWKSWFVWMLQLARITYMYICQLNALQKFLLWECTDLEELLTFVSQFDAFKEFNLLRCFNSKELPSSIAN